MDRLPLARGFAMLAYLNEINPYIECKWKKYIGQEVDRRQELRKAARKIES